MKSQSSSTFWCLILLATGIGIVLGAGLASTRNRTAPSDRDAIRDVGVDSSAVSVPCATGSWPTWNETDPASFAKDLRAMGCPEEFIQDLVVAEMNKTTSRALELSSASRLLATRRHSDRLNRLRSVLGPTIDDIDLLIGLPYMRMEPSGGRTNVIDPSLDTPYARAVVEHLGATEAELRILNEYLTNATGSDALEVEMEKRLGTSRFQELLKYRNAEFREAVSFAKELGLDASVADQICLLRKDTILQRYQLRNSQTSQDAVAAALKERQKYNQERLIELLGQEGARRYTQEAKDGGWLRYVK